MSINETLEKIKPFYYLMLILVIASIFFALWRISSLEEGHLPIRIVYGEATSTELVLETSFEEGGGEVIGSLTGKKYYFPWCGTVNRIKPENRIHFASIIEARLAGYSPAGNCKGLK